MNLRSIDSEVDLAILGLTLGLPRRCECAGPVERQSLTTATVLCDACGGLVTTKLEDAAGLALR